jgi:hypothetical protein
MTDEHVVIVRGRLDDVELAALTAVLAALGGQAAAARRPVATRRVPSWVRQDEFAFGTGWLARPAAWEPARWEIERTRRGERPCTARPTSTSSTTPRRRRRSS